MVFEFGNATDELTTPNAQIQIMVRITAATELTEKVLRAGKYISWFVCVCGGPGVVDSKYKLCVLYVVVESFMGNAHV